MQKIQLKKVVILGHSSEQETDWSVYLKIPGWQFLETGSEEAARGLIQREDPQVFILDIAALMGDPVRCAREIMDSHPKLSVIILSKEKSKYQDFLAAGVYVCLPTPASAKEIHYHLEKLHPSGRDSYDPFSMHSETRIIVLPNDFSVVIHVAKTLVYNALPGGIKNKFQVVMGLNEIITNAIEHGNLGITFEEKNTALMDSNFFALAQNRACQDPYKKRLVTVKAEVFSREKRVVFTVTDEGEGFNWKVLPDPTDRANLLNRNGRGVMIAKYAFDKVEYNDKGNEVQLTYFIKS